ncbi:MAG: AraC family transcriptional regulator [Acidobacteriota bacterium]|nr:AraC family transcriptional regulator [Acidobacteriota bacterium]
MPEFVVQRLLHSPIVAVSDTNCHGSHRLPSAEECTTTTQLVFPYRGVYVRHFGQEQIVADANRVLFFNAGEGYRVSHPIAGGDASLTLVLDPERLRELTPAALLQRNATTSFRQQNLRIDAGTQALVAMLGHRLRANIAEPLEAETLALTLARRALDTRTSRTTSGSAGRQKLVDRAKLVLASEPERRWTLAEIAAEVNVVGYFQVVRDPHAAIVLAQMLDSTSIPNPELVMAVSNQRDANSKQVLHRFAQRFPDYADHTKAASERISSAQLRCVR